MCRAKGHGHDDELNEHKCGAPVYGRTRGGNLKQMCDHCSWCAKMYKIGKQQELEFPRFGGHSGLGLFGLL